MRVEITLKDKKKKHGKKGKRLWKGENGNACERIRRQASHEEHISSFSKPRELLSIKKQYYTVT